MDPLFLARAKERYQRFLLLKQAHRCVEKLTDKNIFKNINFKADFTLLAIIAKYGFQGRELASIDTINGISVNKIAL